MKKSFITFLLLVASASWAQYDGDPWDYFAHQLVKPIDVAGAVSKWTRQSAEQLGLIDWENETLVEKAFTSIRDRRMIHWKEKTSGKHYLRRIPWAYPDNGCELRALVAIGFLEKWWNELTSKKEFSIKKVFAFSRNGPLVAQTENHPDGEIRWGNFHVAPIIFNDGELLVLDPALDFEKAMNLREWAQSMKTKHNKVVVSICSKDTYNYMAGCLEPMVKFDYKDSIKNLKMEAEWNRLLELGRDPLEEVATLVVKDFFN